MSEPFCSEVARQEGAPLAGTATHADAWLLVEHDGPWGARAVEENDLPPVVQEWLQTQPMAIGAALAAARGGGPPARVRPLFIRRDARVGGGAPCPSRGRGTGGEGWEETQGWGSGGGRQARAARGGGIACFLAIAGEDRQELYRFTVARHEELGALDLAGAVSSGELARWRSDQKLVLVCGNGRRDRCCALWGPATFRELAARVGGDAWLSTHQGGHRYAGTGLWLPEGVAHGFLAAPVAPLLVEARRRGEVHLPCFRGRTFHRAPVQAADVLLRQATGELRLAAWRLVDAHETAAGAWQVDFAGDGRRFRVRLRHDTEEALVSCSPGKRKPIDRFTLIDWESEEAA